ncbi:hypothetical protein MRX96_028764 [Rhipicephalus microplus]
MSRDREGSSTSGLAGTQRRVARPERSPAAGITHVLPSPRIPSDGSCRSAADEPSAASPARFQSFDAETTERPVLPTSALSGRAR